MLESGEEKSQPSEENVKQQDFQNPEEMTTSGDNNGELRGKIQNYTGKYQFERIENCDDYLKSLGTVNKEQQGIFS